MNEQETRTIEEAIKRLDESTIELTSLKTEIELQIDKLTKTRDTLVRLLPHEKRIDRLFQ